MLRITLKDGTDPTVVLLGIPAPEIGKHRSHRVLGMIASEISIAADDMGSLAADSDASGYGTS